MDIQLKLFYIPFFIAMLSVLSLTALSGCTPTVQVTASEKPIEVNLNVKIEHEIRIKVDKEIDELFSDDDVF
ncbi:YnbE family lipoprotein [Photobacterium rosenbergii]|uniref:YnbE family lipoprotein n=1 Tax=Photobacterium rosenbergii TaxID=294936 RepID=A0ABU3ZBQ0_9GAMM|nr:YnbE family lipoprotein [Photobacterium rosenbergii]MDV5167536.1 YnbE family lipoprotein [Photobacterium rosenbergii]